jgi:hypothetical protein
VLPNFLFMCNIDDGSCTSALQLIGTLRAYHCLYDWYPAGPARSYSEAKTVASYSVERASYTELHNSSAP